MTKKEMVRLAQPILEFIEDVGQRRYPHLSQEAQESSLEAQRASNRLLSLLDRLSQEGLED